MPQPKMPSVPKPPEFPKVSARRDKYGRPKKAGFQIPTRKKKYGER